MRVVLLLLCTSLSLRALAGAHTDGSLGGPGQSFAGTFTIPAAAGKQKGPNLFHSFDTFTLDRGESATFTGPSSVRYVFARVTGGQPSTIDGTLACDIPRAELFLINPAGVTFGPDAKLDLKGSLSLTTADSISLRGGGRLDAALAAKGTLTSAAPSAFGFLAPHPAGLTVHGSALTLSERQSVNLIGGSTQMDGGATVRAPAGRATLVTPAAPGQVVLNPTNADAPPDTHTVASFGPVTVSENSLIDISGNGGGRLILRGGDVSLTGSNILARTDGSRDGRGASINADRLQLLGGSRISTVGNSGSGAGGGMDIAANAIVLDGSGSPSTTGFTAGPNSKSTGDGRPVSINAGSLGIKNGALINPGTGGDGRGADLTVRAQSVSLSTGGQIDDNASGRGRSGDVMLSAQTLTIDGAGSTSVTGIFDQSKAASTADAGRISLQIERALRVVHGGVISGETFGSGSGADILVSAGSVTVDGSGSGQFTGVLTGAGAAATGAAGSLSVKAGTLQVLAGGDVDTDTGGRGRGGDLRVRATDVTVDGSGAFDPTRFTGLSSDARGTDSRSGSAGNVTVRARAVIVNGGGSIETDTDGPGRSGRVFLSARALTLDGTSSNGVFTGVSSDTIGSDPGAGAAGDVSIRARNIGVLAGAQVASDTSGTGNAGRIRVVARLLRIDDRGDPDPTSFTQISSEANDGASGNAGDVTVRAPSIEIVAAASIVSDTNGPGRGGNVTIVGGRLAIDGTGSGDHFVGVSSDTRGTDPGSGPAGHLAVHIRELSITDGGSIETDTEGPGRSGRLTISAKAITLNGSGSHGAFTGLSSDALGTERVSGSAGDLSVRAASIDVLAGAQIATDTSGPGNAGKLRIVARSLKLDDRGDLDPTSFTQISSEANEGGSGNAGDVIVRARTIDMAAAASIVSDTNGTGRGGNVRVIAGALSIDGTGLADGFAGISTDALGTDPGSGSGGRLSVRTGSTTISAGGAIQANTSGPGYGGRVAMRAGRLTIDATGAANGSFTGIRSQSSGTAAGSGPGGVISVRAKEVSILGGGEVSATTLGVGNAGTIDVRAEQLHIDGQSASQSGVLSRAFAGSGNAGTINIAASTLSLGQDGIISASTFTGGTGGDVVIDASRISLASGAVISANTFGVGPAGNVLVRAAGPVMLQGASQITAKSEVGATGRGGDITLWSARLELLAGAAVTATTLTSGRGGDVRIDTGELTIDDRGDSNPTNGTGIFARSTGAGATGPAGGIRIAVSGDARLANRGEIVTTSANTSGGALTLSARQLTLNDGNISAEANGEGGNVTLRSPTLITLRNNSTIRTVSASQNGGNITIDPLRFTLASGSTVSANAPKGKGGNITINADDLPGVQVGVNVTATGTANTTGRIATNPASTDVTNGLTRLPASLLADEARLRPRCAEGDAFSSFLLTGKGGLSFDPETWQLPAADLRSLDAPTTMPAREEP
jgi:filamentous hemagglutinin family protein